MPDIAINLVPKSINEFQPVFIKIKKTNLELRQSLYIARLDLRTYEIARTKILGSANTFGRERNTPKKRCYIVIKYFICKKNLEFYGNA